jgi:hypothetical protein
VTILTQAVTSGLICIAGDIERTKQKDHPRGGQGWSFRNADKAAENHAVPSAPFCLRR